MNDTKTSAEHHDAERLQREVAALLAGDGAIDEGRAKRLRKRWADGINGDADAGDALAALFGELRARIHEQVARRDKQFAKVEEKLKRLRECVARGEVKKSRQLEKNIVDQLNRIVGLSDQRRQSVINELEKLRPELRKLNSWSKWSATQVREKMIDEIKNIHDSGKSMTQIAKRIQQARKEWPKGEGGAKLYKIFDRACAKAYQPCQAHFEKQKEARSANSIVREKMCDALEKKYEAMDWRDLHWKDLRQHLQGERVKWRKCGPADFKQRKTLQRRFDAIVEKFDERMERERKRNFKLRAMLIDDINKLAERDDVGAALAELKELKKQWAPTVTSSRKKEQALWKRFTDACDAVFAKRERERKDFKRELKQNLSVKKELCAEMENCDDMDALRAGLEKWKARWEKSGEAPKDAAKKINARYQKALADAEQKLSDAGADDVRRELALLREKSSLCAQVEALALTGKGKTKLKALAAKWAKLDALPAAVETAIGARYQIGIDAVDGDGDIKKHLAANLDALNELLLALEIQCEVDSPAEFARRRMALQVERLSAAMGGGDDEAESVDDIVRAILLVGAVEKKHHAAAMRRLDVCLSSTDGD